MLKWFSKLIFIILLESKTEPDTLDQQEHLTDTTWILTDHEKDLDQSNEIFVCDKKGTLPGGINTATQTFGPNGKDETLTWALKYQDEWEQLRLITAFDSLETTTLITRWFAHAQ